MKKLIVTILATIYLVASTGASVNIHYCMDKLVDWSLSHQDANKCGSCGMEKKGDDNGCCKDEQKFLKNSIDQKTVTELQIHPMAVSVPPALHGDFNWLADAPAVEFTRNNDPPPGSTAPIYLLNRVFRI